MANTPQSAAEEVEERNWTQGGQSPEGEDPPTPAKHEDNKEEAKRTSS